MIEFSNLYIEGFCSIDKLNVSLNNHRVNLVVGNNGFGKTTILSALVWCLYGKNLKGVSDVNTWKRYQPKGYIGTKVELYFKINTQVHKVTRCQNYKEDILGAKGGSRLIYEIDTEPVKEKYKPDIQKLITKNIGMSYNLFMNTVMFGQGLKRLIQETNTDKKALFEEIFELSYLSKARDIAGNTISKISQDRSKIDNKILTKLHTIEELKSSIERIERIKKAFKKEKLKEIADKTEQLDEVEKNIDELVKVASKDKKREIKLKIDNLEKKLGRVKGKLEDAKENSSVNIQSLIRSILNLLNNGNQEKAKELLLSIEKAFNDKDKLFSKIEKYRVKISESKQEYSNIENKLYRLSSLEKRKDSLKGDIEDIRNKKLPNSDTSKLKSDIEDIESSLSILKNRSKLTKEKEDNYIWAYKEPLGNNGLKAFIFESSLCELNSLLREYSEVIGFLIQFNVNLGSTKKDFVTQITMDGIEVIYEELSGGQKQLVNLSLALAMNQMVAVSKGVNIAFLDEVFESLSQDNIEIVVSLIQKVYKGKTLFLITHQSSLPISNSRIIRVERVKGLSRYYI